MGPPVQVETLFFFFLFVCVPKGTSAPRRRGGRFSRQVESCHLSHYAAWSNAALIRSVKSVMMTLKSSQSPMCVMGNYLFMHCM